MENEEKIIIESGANSQAIKIISAAFSILSFLIMLPVGCSNAFSSYYHYFYFDEFMFWFAVICLPIVLPAAIIYLYSKKVKITVTNKRVYGSALFGKKVDLPLDSISAVSVSKLLKGIGVSTSSGRIKFLLIIQNQEVYRAISNLLIERQTKTLKVENQELDNVSKIKQYKELLDMGAITQEEFDLKKKELLNI